MLTHNVRGLAKISVFLLIHRHDVSDIYWTSPSSKILHILLHVYLCSTGSFRPGAGGPARNWTKS